MSNPESSASGLVGIHPYCIGIVELAPGEADGELEFPVLMESPRANPLRGRSRLRGVSFSDERALT